MEEDKGWLSAGGGLVAIMSPPLFSLHLVGPKRCPSGDITGRAKMGGSHGEGEVWREVPRKSYYIK